MITFPIQGDHHIVQRIKAIKAETDPKAQYALIDELYDYYGTYEEWPGLALFEDIWKFKAIAEWPG